MTGQQHQLHGQRGRDGGIAAILLAAVALTGCADIGQRPPVNQDRVVGTALAEAPVAGADADVDQDGVTLSISVSRVCDRGPARTVDRTSTTESFNRFQTANWLLAAAGVVSAGVGAGLVADAANTYPNDRASRTFNETGPGKERLYGYALIGTGAFFGVVAIVDAVRANGTTVEQKRITLPMEPEKRAIRCSNQPFANAAVSGGLLDADLPLGKTNAHGELEVNLEQAIPEETGLSPSLSKLELRVEGHVAGSVDLRPLFLRREGQAFSQSDSEGCAHPTTVDSCALVKAFLLRYPDGPHAKEAQAILDGAAPKLAVLQDDRRWSQVRVDACTKDSFAAPGEVLGACAPIGQYVTDFPDGRHIAAAKQALSVGEARAQRLGESILHEAKAQEAKEAADQRRQCVARCRVGCSGWGIRDQASCFSGCVDLQCSGSNQ